MKGTKRQFPQFGGPVQGRYSAYNNPELVSSPSPQKKLGLVIKVVAGVVILIVVGVGAALATRIWDPLWNPFRPGPEEVLGEMFTKMSKVKILHSETRLNYTTKGDVTFNMSLRVSGDSDTTDSENPKLAFSFDIRVQGKPPAAGTADGFSLAIESKTVDKNSYFKLNTIEPQEILAFLMMFGVDVDKIQRQWIKINKESLEDLGMSDGEEVPEEEQEATVEKIKKVFREIKIYRVKEELPDKKIDGKRMYHYLLVLDNNKIKRVISEVLQISMETYSESAETSFGFGSTFFVGAITGAIEEFLNKIGEITFEVWIGKKDKLLYKVKAEKEIDMSKFEKTAKEKVTITFDLEFSKFGQPVQIEPPTDFIELEDIILLFPSGSILPELYAPLEEPCSGCSE